MLVSILIVHYKTLKLTTDCIRSVKNHTKGVEYEIIVIDNDSNDGAKEVIQQQNPDIQWVEMGYNAGFARANNAGIRASKGDFVLLLNSDTLFLDDIISKSVHHLETELDVAACGGIQLYENGEERHFYRSIAVFKRTLVVLPPHRIFDKFIEKIFPETIYSDSQQVDWIPAAFLLVRKNVIDKTGLLDEDFFMYAEDVEWNCRLARVGKLKTYDDCRYIHYEWGSNPDRKMNQITPINRFFTQIQLSNLVWIRKEYGVFQYLLFMINYYLMVPIYFGWKIAVNIKNGQNPLSKLENQKDYYHKINLFAKYFWKIVLKRPYFYKLPVGQVKV